jgi:hypothetical protein
MQRLSLFLGLFICLGLLKLGAQVSPIDDDFEANNPCAAGGNWL